MHRTATAPIHARFPHGVSISWLARRWYYTPRTHRAYSVRQISPGDRRLLAEFALALDAGDCPIASSRDCAAHATCLFDRVIARRKRYRRRLRGAGIDRARAIASSASAAYAPTSDDSADFSIAVARRIREEQVGRTLLSTLLRHAKRVGVPQLAGEMVWSNRPMQMLAMSMGFAVEPLARDRTLRRLVLALK